MPELPEVEIVKRQLDEHLVGHVVEGVEVFDRRILDRGEEKLVGKTIEKVDRRGKGIIIELSGGVGLVVHLKMTGQLIYRADGWESGEDARLYEVSKKVKGLPGKYTRVILHLDGAKLYYNDVRRFGWMRVVDKDEVEKLSFFENLGPEPNDLLEEDFALSLKKSRMSLKSFLLDQKKIAGIGNIYANDALWKAEINPRREAKSLSAEEVTRLLKAIHDVLRRGIDSGAASDNSYVNALGGEGGYQNEFLVYSREGRECRRCGGVIKKMSISGRGTFWCGECQT